MTKHKHSKKEPKSSDEAEESTVVHTYEAKATVKTEEQTLSYDEKLQFVNAISKPMAPRKLAKKLYKLIRKASKHKKDFSRGIKKVQQSIRKGGTGIVVLAGDVTPIDIISHLPAVCEERNISYVYTPSKQDIGSALGVRRGCIVLMIPEHADYKELYDGIKTEINFLPIPTK